MTTTNIDQWLTDMALEDHNEIEDLYTSVVSEMNMNMFHISINENQPRRIFVMPVMKDLDTLMLTDSSKPVFIRKLEHMYCNDMDAETYCSLEHEKSKITKH
ncbi:MAG: hypothetical protein NC113_03035 [Bacteroides sp.]|nr:hypothetical protein [Bacteroides sp.]MCM1447186.1 hypothetical protein [Bacteroides sp.]MCM1515076.1 hypothetical protein [Paraprevotella sp.]